MTVPVDLAGIYRATVRRDGEPAQDTVEFGRDKSHC